MRFLGYILTSFIAYFIFCSDAGTKILSPPSPSGSTDGREDHVFDVGITGRIDMGGRVRILVKCSACKKSLMNPDVQVDGLPSIHLGAKVLEKTGNIYLSQIYGSFNKKFEDVDDITGSVALFFCPHCHNPFPVREMCDCGAPMIDLNLEVGGVIKIGTRNGCEHHSLQFVEADNIFSLFHDQDKSGLS